MQLMIIAAIAVAIVSVVFALQNTAAVSVHFLLWQFDSTLALVLLLAVATGALIVALLSTPATLRSQWQLARQRRKISELETANATLRARAETPPRPGDAGRESASRGADANS